jgi:hypothetical protein
LRIRAARSTDWMGPRLAARGLGMFDIVESTSVL